THRELVAEVARGGLTHAGNANVLAQTRDELDVVVIERRETVDLPRAAEITECVDDRLRVLEVGEREHLVDVLAAPWFVELLLDCQEDDGAPFLLTRLDELVSLEIRRDADDRDRLGHGH